MKPLLRAVRLAGSRISSAALEGAVRTAAALSHDLPEPPRPPESIFVLRNNDVGDLLVVTPLFDALRRLFPEARMTAGVGSWNLDVLKGNPHLSEALAVNAPWFNKYQARAGTLGRLSYLRSPEVQALRERRFEVGIDVLGSAWGSLLLLKARIPYRLGVRGYAGGHSATQRAVSFNPDEHVGRSALRFAELLGATDLPPVRPQIFLTPEETGEAERWWTAAEEGRRRRRVVIAPGGGLPEKRWPAESFAAVAAGLSRDASVLVLGGLGENDLVARVTGAAPGIRSLPDPPRLRRFFAFLAASDLVITNSSMPLHAAAAFGKPVVTLLGPSFPSARQHQAQWGYPGLSRSFGREPGERETLYTPEEILHILREEAGG